MKYNYFSEEVDFQINNSSIIEKKLSFLETNESKKVDTLNYIFCSDAKILEINKQYLNHDYYTDIITFDQSDTPTKIEGDIFISIDRIKENADQENVSFENELHRVMIHGLLHLVGYKDKSEGEQKKMTEKEDFYLTSS